MENPNVTWLGPVPEDNCLELHLLGFGETDRWRCKKCWYRGIHDGKGAPLEKPHTFGSRFEYDLHVMHRHWPPT